MSGGDSYLTCKAVISPDIHSSRLTADVSTTVLQIETELSVEENPNIEDGLAVFPNPFSDLLTVNFVGEGDAQIQIFDVLGTQITSGRRSLTWDGRDQNGVKLPNGIYFAAVKAKGNVQLKKIFLCK